MISFLISCGVIAGSLLLNQAYNWINSAVNKKKKISSDDIIKATNLMINEARTKGNDILDRLYSKLSNINLPFSASPNLKQYYSQIRNQANKQYTRAKKELNEVESNLNTIERRLDNYNAQPDDIKNIVYPNIKEELISDAKQQIDKIQSVENKIVRDKGGDNAKKIQ